MNYLFMNKDIPLISFHTENAFGSIIVREDQVFTDQLPIGFLDISTWIENRNYAKHKKHFSKWLKEWGINTIDGFLQVSHCLGINDTLWIKPQNSSLTWAEVSLYKNEFSDVASHTAFETGLFGLQLSSTSPEFTTDGSFPKCWIKENDKISLIKAGMKGASNVGLEPYSEYMASCISKILQPESVKYDLVLFKNELCSICDLFTNEDKGFISFAKIAKLGKTYTIPDVIKICTDLGYEVEAKRMFLIDSIVFNQDRHLGNFGFIVDNNTFQIIGFAPLFDYNISMLCNGLMEDLLHFDKYVEEYQVGHKLGGTFTEVGHSLIHDANIDLPKELILPEHKEYNLPQERMKVLSSLFEKNYNEIKGIKKYFVQNNNSIEDIELD